MVVSVDVVELSSCGDGSITVNASGGNGILVYAIVPANTSPAGLFSTTNTLTVTDAMAQQGRRLETAVAVSTYYVGFNMLDPVVGGTNEDSRESAKKLRQAMK